ncbi:hypothetical protein Cgig2_002120 [Carnegiea gigantea]|uniref:GRF-type domain-containing protein n=1 Tax=Carnegiea gigantea TaxID=171969 RepID=A0A9Q1QS90_9CARY|nr:hypothetical protein Cgig2_002120 [Carnegiea gigantea]
MYGPVPVPIPVGGGDFSPLRAGAPTGTGIPRLIAIPKQLLDDSPHSALNSPPPTAAAALDCAKFGSPPAAIILAENTTVALANMYAKSLLFWGDKNCGFFKWCDKLREDEIRKSQPEFNFPICRCGAGVCTVRVEESGPNAGRKYFACPIKKGDGTCNFKQWLDDSPHSALVIPEDVTTEQNILLEQFDLSHEEAMQIDALEMAAHELPLERGPHAEFPSTHCRCGAGLCEIRVAASRDNSGRKYYRCPGKYDKTCGFFKWCDKLREDEIRKSQPEFNFPICRCGAGVCTVRVEESGPNAGRKYFACPIKKGDGTCNFKQWLDDSPHSALVIPEDVTTEQNILLEQFDLSHEEAMQIDALEMAAHELPLERGPHAGEMQ